MEVEKFSVGDRVYCQGRIGTIRRITPKRTIEVDFGSYTSTFKEDGMQNTSGPYWYRSQLYHLTPEIERDIQEQKTIRKCKDMFSHADLSAEQAEKIIEILSGSEK